MSDCPIGFTADDKKWLDKIRIDMYVGDGPDNPSVTTRLSVLEKESDVVNSVKVALFGDEKTDGLIVKFERVISFARGVTKALAIAGALALALFGYALTQIVPAAKIVIDDYYHNHPAAKHSLNAPPQQANTKNQQLTDGFEERYDPRKPIQ